MSAPPGLLWIHASRCGGEGTRGVVEWSRGGAQFSEQQAGQGRRRLWFARGSVDCECSRTGMRTGGAPPAVRAIRGPGVWLKQSCFAPKRL